MHKLSSNLFVTNVTAEYAEKMMTLGHTIYAILINFKSYGIILFILPFKRKIGATHCTELNYIFGANIFPIPFKCTKTDEYVRNVTSKLWTNFSKFGNPNGANNMSTLEGFKWLPVVRKPTCYLSIGTDAFQMKEEYYYHQTKFWQNF
uniref:Carboxylesterase type B domain-containing protein n=1 Tax=Wuchereria bancrofti TaxID=6293 RepID=A0AAF5PJN2_WUCBA